MSCKRKIPEIIIPLLLLAPPRKRRKRYSRVIISPTPSSIKDLIEIAEASVEYSNINTRMLRKILPQLQELNDIIGMRELKNTIFDQIIFYIQELDKNNSEYLHTAIFGPPGAGKTMVAKIIGELYKNLGILSPDGKFTSAKRDDFVAKYLGQTAIKTKKLLNSCLGGVLFIDEAYSMGTGSIHNSYSKEAIDTLNPFLSEHKDNFCCIIAGYEDDIKRCFFSLNKGLERRFSWIHVIEPYTSDELAAIFLQMVHKVNWQIIVPKKDISELMNKDKDLFKNLGGDVELFLTKSKISQRRRTICLSNKHKSILIKEDLKNGIKLMKKNRISKDEIPFGMYT